MNILLLGSGGREHALAWKITQSKHLSKLYIAPGNAGTAMLGENSKIDINNFDAVKQFVVEHSVNIVIVGPEVPLVNGIYDYFIADKDIKHIPVIGPSKIAAQLEGSKTFAKQFMKTYQIPSAAYQSFTKQILSEGLKYLETIHPPYVLKADGLAAGKGVVILTDLKEAKKELCSMLVEEKFGNASEKVVIEEFLQGIELSVFVITDGLSYKILPSAKDYKRIGEGDTGLNTGGMGAISPVPFADKNFMGKVEQGIIIPTIKGLHKEKINYKGFIFFGLMNVKGNPYVIEYNVRMGDPESEVVIPRIKTDILDLFNNVANGTLQDICLEIDNRTAATIMLVAKGYPEKYEKGKVITGLNNITDSVIFHAGTDFSADKKVITNGGRVLTVTSFGKDIKEALKTSYHNADRIHFDGKYFRRDIGFDL